jgi:hypothetical protein
MPGEQHAMGRSVPIAISFALLYISIALALPNHGLAAPERQPVCQCHHTFSNMTTSCDDPTTSAVSARHGSSITSSRVTSTSFIRRNASSPAAPCSTSTHLCRPAMTLLCKEPSSRLMFLRTTECSNATVAASSNATTTFSPTTQWRHLPTSKSEPCDGELSGIHNASSHTRMGWKKPCPTCQSSEEVSPGHTAHHIHHAEQPHHLHHQPHRQHDRPQHGPRPRPGAGRHSPPSSTTFGTTTPASTSGTSTLPTHAAHSRHHPLTEFRNTTVASTSGTSTLLGHTTYTGHHPGIGISASISVNLTLPTLPTHSRPRPTELLAAIENFQVLAGSSSLLGATGTIRHAPSPGFPAAGLAGGSDSRVVPGATETVTAQSARLTGGVEPVMVSKLGGCLAGLVGVVALLA